jgi:hypothetical protein
VRFAAPLALVLVTWQFRNIWGFGAREISDIVMLT